MSSLFVILVLCILNINFVYCNHKEAIEKILREEDLVSLGGTIILYPQERQANKTFMKYKLEEIEKGKKNISAFLPASNFLTVSHEIERSKSYELLQKLPKGAALCGYQEGMVSVEYIVRNLTYRDNLYAKIKKNEPDNLIELKFIMQNNKSIPTNETGTSKEDEPVTEVFEITTEFTKESKNTDFITELPLLNTASYTRSVEENKTSKIHSIVLDYLISLRPIKPDSGFKLAKNYINGSIIINITTLSENDFSNTNFKNKNETFDLNNSMINATSNTTNNTEVSNNNFLNQTEIVFNEMTTRSSFTTPQTIITTNNPNSMSNTTNNTEVSNNNFLNQTEILIDEMTTKLSFTTPQTITTTNDPDEDTDEEIDEYDDEIETLADATDDGYEWISVKSIRESKGIKYDAWMTKQLSLHKEFIDLNANEIQIKFRNVINKISSMLSHESVFKDHFYQMLKEFHEDNIDYLEFRTSLPPVYNSNGKPLNEIQIVKLYIDVLNAFKKEYPNFFGAKLIYAPRKSDVKNGVVNSINTAIKLKASFFDFIAGIDLGNYDDIKNNIAILSEYKDKINFFWHAKDVEEDDLLEHSNLVDVIQFGAKRIGHGLSITKHPKLEILIKKNMIGLEICPTSNQVLGLVPHLKIHPLSIMLQKNYPVVICSDSPGVWGAKGTTYDWYETFIGISSINQNLRLLKKLAMNSIQQSSMSETERDNYLKIWERRWDNFINAVIKNEVKKYK